MFISDEKEEWKKAVTHIDQLFELLMKPLKRQYNKETMQEQSKGSFLALLFLFRCTFALMKTHSLEGIRERRGKGKQQGGGGTASDWSLQ